MDSIREQVNELMKNQRHILEAIKYLDERVENSTKKAPANENNDVQDILESQKMIDGIIVKNADDIAVIKKQKEETDVAIKVIEDKIEKFNVELDKSRKNNEDKVDKERTPSLLKCKLCDHSFKRFVDLESHMLTNHSKYQDFQCDKCEKRFFLKWRLKKHMDMHSQVNVKHCHYFNNGKMCPFEQFGCKFLHVVSEPCKLGLTCSKYLCHYRHSGETIDSSNITETEDDDLGKEGMDTSSDTSSSFVTSTPEKRRFRCDKCDKNQQCMDCFVKQTVGAGKIAF